MVEVVLLGTLMLIAIGFILFCLTELTFSIIEKKIYKTRELFEPVFRKRFELYFAVVVTTGEWLCDSARSSP